MDKAGIIISIAIVTAAVGFTLTGGSGIPSDIAPNIEKTTMPLKEDASKKLQEIKESGSEAVAKITEGSKLAVSETEKLTETAKELATSKLPARLVSIPKGTAMPGCEIQGRCYDPPSLIIFVGGEVIWKNDDASAHTVTSGIALTGPDGNFDSSLIKAGETFSHRFEESGEFRYFCMIHPWAEGSVTVK
jgi:plastocyanin